MAICYSSAFSPSHYLFLFLCCLLLIFEFWNNARSYLLKCAYKNQVYALITYHFSTILGRTKVESGNISVAAAAEAKIPASMSDAWVWINESTNVGWFQLPNKNGAPLCSCKLWVICVAPKRTHIRMFVYIREGGNRIYSPRFGVATPTTRGQQRCDT